MSRATKAVSNLLVGLLLGAIVSFPFIYFPEVSKRPYEVKKLSSFYTINEKKAISRSVQSSVQVFSLNMENLSLALMSGTYVTYKGKYYVFTSAHGIVGKCSEIKISFYDSSSRCLEITYIDREKDYAIIEIEKMHNRVPVKFPEILANPKKSFNLLDKVYYTGYPSNIGPTTWQGTIAGRGASNIIIQSYAWSGASGSGVFDEKGDLIGIIMALNTGKSSFGTQVLENFVILVPIWAIEWEKVFKE